MLVNLQLHDADIAKKIISMPISIHAGFTDETIWPYTTYGFLLCRKLAEGTQF